MTISPFKERLRDSLQSSPYKVAMRVKRQDAWQEIRYAQLRLYIENISSFMAAKGIEKGDRVLLLAENGPLWAGVFLACIDTGVVLVPLDTHSTPKDIGSIADDSEAKVIIVSESILADDDRLKDLKNIETLIILESIGLCERSEASVEDAESADNKRPCDVCADDLALILYTSGTTDRPKGVMLTHNNLYSNYLSISKLGMISSRDTVLSILPLYHSYPLMVNLIVPVLGNAGIVYVPEDWPQNLTDYVRGSKVTILTGVPQMFYMLHRRIANTIKEMPFASRVLIEGLFDISWSVRMRTGLNLARILFGRMHKPFGRQLRFFVTGGARIDADAQRDLFRWGFTVLEGYGLTETSPVVSFNPPARPKIGSVGKAIDSVELKIVGKDKDGIGEIAIRGPNLMRGYYGREEETRKAIREGWFFSGDLGYIDDNGYLYITGRSKELIVLSSGKNIYPEEVEAAYSALPFVKEICVLGLAKQEGSGTQDMLYAVVLPDLDALKARGEMNVYDVLKSRFTDISAGLPSHKHIMGFMVINEPLPRTSLGKIQRHLVRARYIEKIANKRSEADVSKAGGAGDTLGHDIAGKVIKYIRENFNIKKEIALQDSIEIDLGIDSLGRLEMLAALESIYGLDLPDEMVGTGIFTVKDLVEKIQHLLKASGTGQRRSTGKPLQIEDIMSQPISEGLMSKIHIRSDLFDRYLTVLFRSILYIILKVFYRFTVRGADNIPRRGPYIICPNHVSFLDGFIIACAVPSYAITGLFFIGFRQYFKAFGIRSMVRRARILPVDADQIIEAMQASKFIIKSRKALCIFPEGERTPDGKVKAFKKGVGVLAKDTGARLIPVFIEGAFEAWPRRRRFPRPGRIRVSFGVPVDPRQLLDEARGRGLEDDDEAIAQGIRDRVIRLKEI